MNICQRIVSQVGRRVDESSPICDARLPDGSRVNVIAPPLAIDGPTLTIRKFKKDKLTLDQLVRFGAISPEGATILKIIGRVRCNVVISGGTGSGKTTLLNCLTRYIDARRARHHLRGRGRAAAAAAACRAAGDPPAEPRRARARSPCATSSRTACACGPSASSSARCAAPKAFDLLQAMNTGHDGSMGTLHANSPREACRRIESMITMGGFSLPSRTIREMICASIDVIVQAARLRDGSRRITHITEVMGMEGDVIITQDLFLYEIVGEDAERQAHRPAPVDRHRPPAVLGAGALLRRGEAARRRPRRHGTRRRGRRGMTVALVVSGSMP